MCVLPRCLHLPPCHLRERRRVSYACAPATTLRSTSTTVQTSVPPHEPQSPSTIEWPSGTALIFHAGASMLNRSGGHTLSSQWRRRLEGCTPSIQRRMLLRRCGLCILGGLRPLFGGGVAAGCTSEFHATDGICSSSSSGSGDDIHRLLATGRATKAVRSYRALTDGLGGAQLPIRRSQGIWRGHGTSTFGRRWFGG